MTLLREIQNEATDSRVPVAQVLRKCKILAARLGHAELGSWVNQELHGYKAEEEVPRYRRINAHAYFTWTDGVDKYGPAPLPVSDFPKEVREYMAHYRFLAGLETYESMAARGEDFSHIWPQQMTSFISGKVVRNGRIVEVWWMLPNAALRGLVSGVRDRILSYALELEGLAPSAGEGTAAGRVAQEQLSQAFNLHIYGGTNNVAAGSRDFKQSITVEARIGKGDLDALREYLRGLKVPEEDVAELSDALRDVGPTPEKELPKPVKNWIGGMVYKAASGAWDVAVGAAGELLASALSAYLGIKR